MNSSIRRSFSRAWPWIRRLVELVLGVVLGLILLASSTVTPPSTTEQKVRSYTRSIEFDFVGWMLSAARLKFFESALSAHNYMTPEMRRQTVTDYLALVQEIFQKEWELRQIYADPQVTNPDEASAELREYLNRLYEARAKIAPVAEGTLEQQINTVVSDLGLTIAGQAVPPVMYHSTPLPMALIVSPRDVIRTDAHISLVPNLTLDQQVKLEEQVDESMDVSSLVVRIGGVGTYPTMVAETTDLEWLSEVVAHEWIHNYLMLRPLGVSYLEDEALKTMNETTASIAGKEIGRMVLERYYPELIPQPPAEAPAAPAAEPEKPAEPPPFDFNKEMHQTRVTVDALLKEGKIDEAEAYMEERRKLFWDQGYRGLRKLNQAYFAFYGAYADEPLGAAGEDPVGAAVRALRAQSPSLTAFLQQMAWMSSFDDLKAALGEK